MTNDHDGDHMDELLVQAARDYNAPLSVPREEMWSRIQSARSAQKTRRTSRVWVWPSVGVAAAVLMTAGVLIGRNWERSRGTAATVARSTSPSSDSAPQVASSSTPATPESTTEIIGQLRRETAATDRRVRELASATSANDPAAAGESADASSSLSYRLVVLKHLAGSEAMITAFRSAAKRGELDAQIAAWSKELLSTTRMLEVSAASDDPMMRRLLEDLDLVLAQIKQYVTRGTNNPDDLDLIEQSINKRGVMTKLRSTLPGRTSPVGT